MVVAAVVMAGGKGERFWPKSRVKFPKQLLNLTGKDTMIQQAIKRLEALINDDNIYIITNEDYAQLISQQVENIKPRNILIEPMGKNTAACIGLAAVHIGMKDPEAVMVIIPSDHLIKDCEEFKKTLELSIQLANKADNIITIGIKPTYPETGYGYIKIGKENDNAWKKDVFRVDRFVEKPDKKTAEGYIESNDYLWNSGMFVLKVSTLYKNMKKFMPDLYTALENIRESIGTDEEDNILNKEYSKLESISIDYGIMEKTKSIYVIPASFGWDDVGTWTSLERIHKPDGDGNILEGNILSVESKKCIIQGMNDKLIAVMGIEDVIVVDTGDVTLVCSKQKAQNMKDLLKEIKNRNMENYL